MSQTAKYLAKHLRNVYFGPNWITSGDVRKILTDVDWKEATTQIHDFNPIALLLFHLNYYVKGVIPVFDGDDLTIHDKYSFDMPPITSEEDWQKLKQDVWENVETLVQKIEVLSDEQIWQPFANVDNKYGNYFTNITAMIEHTHYHFGQILLIKKRVKAEK